MNEMKDIAYTGNEVLKILPSYEYNPDKLDTVPSDIDERALPMGWWYLHGKLESEVRYDKGMFYDLPKYMEVEVSFKNEETYTDSCVTGIYRCELYGIEKPCVGFFWITKWPGSPAMQRGLVCFEDDADAVEHAMTKYNDRSEVL